MSTLAEDIYKVLSEGCEVSDAKANEFGSEIAALIKSRLTERLAGPREFTLRMSNIGKGARQLFYEKNYPEESEKLSGQTLLKFLIGDILESTLLFLAEQSGHAVTERQAEVNLNGIKGHIDADIDGITVDIKSASPHAFKKFKFGTLPEDDPFGYLEQIAGYSKARNTDGAFLTMDKVSGELAYLHFSQEYLANLKIEDRVEFVKEAVDSINEPERCYPDEEYGKSGNRALGIQCNYCSFKKRCWSDANNGLGLRKFQYSSGPVWFTKIVVEPKVFESTF